jgi:hypothetical protein
MSPGGSAGFATMKERLKNGYIVVFLVEAKNGDWPPIVGNFLAAHDDVVQRLRVQEGMKFATGQSGGARASSVFAQIRPGFSGLILQSAGASYHGKGTGQYNVAGLKRNQELWVAMTMGNSDSNRTEIDAFSRQFGTAHFKAFPFDGGHAWAPPATFAEAMDWIEHKIYFEGAPVPALRPVYLQYFNDHLAGYQSAASPWEKYKAANDLLAFARTRNLAMDPQVGASLRDLQATVTQLRNDPAVSKEALAADMLARVEADKSHTTATQFAAECQDIQRRYPGTEAAAKAQAMATASVGK